MGHPAVFRWAAPVLAGLLCACVSGGQYKKLNDESAAVRKQLDETRAALGSSANDLSDTRGKLSVLERKIADSEARLSGAGQTEGELRARIAEVEGSLARAKGRMETLEKERDQLQQANADLSKSLGAKQDELSKTVSRLQGELSEAKKSLALTQQKSADYEAALRDLGVQLDQTKARAAQLEGERGQLQQANADLSKSLGAKQDELSKTVSSLSEDKRGLEARIAEISRTAEELKASRERDLAQTKSTYESLVGELRSEIDKGQVQITQIQGKLSVNVADTIFFDSGKAEIKDGGRKVLQRVGDILKHLTGKQIRIEGHTDNVPIGGALRERYPTNWELSTARATTVARFLQEKTGVDPSLLTAAGYGEHRPVAANDAETGRAKNRRIEIVLIDREIGRALP